MKKSLIIFSLIFALFATSYAQEVSNEPVDVNPTAATNGDNATAEEQICHHRINIHLGGAWNNNIYRRMDIMHQNYSLSGIFDFQYAYFFNKHWGLGLGVSLSTIQAKGTMNATNVIKDYSLDNEFNQQKTLYDLYIDATDVQERQSVYALEIPLQAQFEWMFNQKVGIYAALGIKAYLPLYAKNYGVDEKEQGTLITYGYEHYTDCWYYDMPNHYASGAYSLTASKNVGMGSNEVEKNYKMRASVDMIADFGALFTMCPKADFYVGAYCGVGFLDILPKEKINFADVNSATHSIDMNNTLSSDILTVVDAKSKTWHNVNVGLKIGVHIRPCGHLNRESTKDLKRRYMNEMMKKSQEPIIVKNQEYVYIVPVCDNLTDDDIDEATGKKKLSAKEKEQLRQLAEVLSRTKILFDLDKDIPKINDQNDNIDKTVEILKNNPSFGLQVEGYTCDLGSEEHNRDLAARRANKVKEMFILKGVPASQISTVTYTANDAQNKSNIPDASREEHRAAIFRILVN